MKSTNHPKWFTACRIQACTCSSECNAILAIFQGTKGGHDPLIAHPIIVPDLTIAGNMYGRKMVVAGINNTFPPVLSLCYPLSNSNLQVYSQGASGKFCHNLKLRENLIQLVLEASRLWSYIIGCP